MLQHSEETIWPIINKSSTLMFPAWTDAPDCGMKNRGSTAAAGFLNDSYDLMCWSTELGKLVSCRVDRMEGVTMLETPACMASHQQSQFSAQAGKKKLPFSREGKKTAFASFMRFALLAGIVIPEWRTPALQTPAGPLSDSLKQSRPLQRSPSPP